MLELGFSPSEYKNLLYFDGHERPDVVELRKKYVNTYNSLQKYSRIHRNHIHPSRRINDPLKGEAKTSLAATRNDQALIGKRWAFGDSQSRGGKTPESPDAATILYPGANKDNELN
ncbi:hypothetical protein PSTG_07657 [Puccinia striiformis f. sp. tritici PST-78]|uniref:Uncharacterized protein n=1 Tax=Puccinia striiformis f. sp. tritici PST-78 TaxID=1165861 RepID=A0A0L0VII1_9BASI|nr:hypothetical protein PSTG_07657 [Puccinia striiformis f. sp. tritici PST-78]